MNLLEYAIETRNALDVIPQEEFSGYFTKRKMEAFHLFHLCDSCKKDKELQRRGEKSNHKDCLVCNRGLIMSTSQGISFFDNIIKFWDNPQSFFQRDKKEKYSDNMFEVYEENFIRLLELNKGI